MILGEISAEEAKNCQPVAKFYENEHLLFMKDHPVAWFLRLLIMILLC